MVFSNVCKGFKNISIYLCFLILNEKTFLTILLLSLGDTNYMC